MAFEIYFLCLYVMILMLEFLFGMLKTFGNQIV